MTCGNGMKFRNRSCVIDCENGTVEYKECNMECCTGNVISCMLTYYFICTCSYHTYVTKCFIVTRNQIIQNGDTSKVLIYWYVGYCVSPYCGSMHIIETSVINV